MSVVVVWSFHCLSKNNEFSASSLSVQSLGVIVSCILCFLVVGPSAGACILSFLIYFHFSCIKFISK